MPLLLDLALTKGNVPFSQNISERDKLTTQCLSKITSSWGSLHAYNLC